MTIWKNTCRLAMVVTLLASVSGCCVLLPFCGPGGPGGPGGGGRDGGGPGGGGGGGGGRHFSQGQH